MSGKQEIRTPRRLDRFALSIVGLLAMPAVFLAFLWWMSPLGLGFAGGPADPVHREWAHRVHAGSYFGGIPMLLAGQLIGIVLAIRGQGRWALCASVGAIVLFLGAVMLALGLRGLP